MPDVNFGGDASGAIAAAMAAQAAIDSVHGKTEHINIEVTGSRALGTAAANMGKFATSSNDASAALERHAQASERATAGASAHASATRDQSQAVAQLGRNSRTASGHLDKFTRSSGDADRAGSQLGDTVDGITKGFGGLGSGASGAGSRIGGMTGEVGSLGGVLGSAIGPLSTLGTVMAYSAAGSGVLTAAVGALGAVGVASLGAVGAAAGLAGAGMVGFTMDAQKDSVEFGKKLEHLGKQAHLASQTISDPMAGSIVGLGKALVSTDSKLTPAGRSIQNSLKQGFQNAADVIDSSSGSIVESGVRASAGFAQLTGEAAPGVKAFLGQLPDLTSGAVAGLSQITTEFGRQAGAITGATPALNQMMGSLGGLGAELVHIGGDALAPFARDVGSMTDGVTGMAKRLEPAIAPSMTAVTDLVNAGTGGIGSLGDPIAEFAGSVSKNAPALESIVGSLGRGMLSLGTAAVDGVGMAAPAIGKMAQAIEQNQPAITDAVGTLTAGGADLINFAANAVTGMKQFDQFTVDAASVPPVTDGKSTGGIPFMKGQHGEESDFDYISRTGGIFGAISRSVSGTPDPPRLMADGSGPVGGGGPTGGGPSGGGLPSSYVPNVPKGAPLPKNASPAARLANELGVDPSKLPGALGERTGGGPAAVDLPGPGQAWPGGPTPTSPGPPPPSGPGVSTPVGSPAELRGLTGAPAPVPGGVPTPTPIPGLPSVPGSQAGPGQVFSGLFTGAAQSAQQGAQAVPQAMQTAMQQVPKVVENAAPAAATAGAAVGASIGAGVAQGVTTTITVTDTVIRKHVTRIIDEYEGGLDAHSPARNLFPVGRSIPQGVGVGLASATGSATAGIAGMAQAMTDVANDASLPMGYSFARNVVSGAQEVFKTANLQPVGSPNLGNERVTAGLGSAGLLGPAVGGASIYKSLATTFDGGTLSSSIASAVAAAVSGQPIHLTLNVDGQFVDKKIVNAQDRLVEMLTEAFS